MRIFLILLFAVSLSSQNLPSVFNFRLARGMICKQKDRDFDCARKMEASFIQKGDQPFEWASRANTEKLILQLNQGTKVLEDSDNDRYSVVTYYQDQESFLIHVSHKDSSEFKLIHRSTGQETELANAPVFSPSGRRMIDARVDLWQGKNPHIVRIWQKTQNQWKKIWEYVPKQWGLVEPAWENEDTIWFMKMNKDLKRKGPFQLVEKEEKWKIQGPIKTSKSQGQR